MMEKRGFNLELAAVCFISVVTMNRILQLDSKLIKLVITFFFADSVKPLLEYSLMTKAGYNKQITFQFFKTT